MNISLKFQHIKVRLTICRSLLFFLSLTACTSEGVKRGLYDGLYQKQCMDHAKMPNCDPGHKTYDQYQYNREETLGSNR